MSLRIAQAVDTTEGAKVYADTSIDNIASRKGILAVGFEPKGIIDMFELRLPNVKSWAWGSHNVDADHPRLDGGINS